MIIVIWILNPHFLHFTLVSSVRHAIPTITSSLNFWKILTKPEKQPSKEPKRAPFLTVGSESVGR